VGFLPEDRFEADRRGRNGAARDALEASSELVTAKEFPAGDYSICFQAEMPWRPHPLPPFAIEFFGLEISSARRYVYIVGAMLES
jgi:hypothetical protein